MGKQSAEHTIKRHHFSPEVRQRLRPYFRRDNWRVLVALVEDWSVVAAGVAVSLWAWRAWPLVPAVVVYAVVVLVIGSRQRALATLLHDAVHGILARHRLINGLCGTLPAGYLIGQSFTGYSRSHLHRHHAQFGDPFRDPDYAELRTAGLYGSDVSPERVRRHLRRLLHPASMWRYLKHVWRHRMLSPDEARGERVGRLTYVAALVGLAVWAGLGPHLLFYWVVPLLTTSSWIGGLLELAEHYPFMERGPRIDIYMSRNRLCGPVINFLLGVHHESYHLVHHLLPSMPSGHYPRVHRILLEDPVYASLNQARGWAAIVCDLTFAPVARRPAWREVHAS